MATPKPVEKRKVVLEDTLLVSVIKRYFKYASAAIAVWGFGRFDFSPAWILLGLMVVVWKEKHNKLQQRKIEISQQASRNEKEAILARVEDLPSWVFFPDVERAEWLNKMIAQMWPYIGDYVQGLLMTTVQKTVQESASVMGSFKFLKIDLGDIPPRIGGVKVYTEQVKRDEIYMDLDIIYSSDCEIEIQMKGIKAGIKDLQLHGTVRVILKPLLSTIPLFGGLSVFFINNPSIDFNLTSLANALDVPGLNDMLQTIIQEQIANIMVLPNRIVVEMSKGLDITRLRYPQPHGVLRIHVMAAKDLVKADVSLVGKGKSDPYTVVRVGAMKFKTHVINNTVAPEWNCVFETVIDEREGQFMDIEVRDEDTGGKDDKLGTVSIDLSPVAEKGMVDNWLPLENVKTGKLHLKLVWLYLSKDPQELNKSLKATVEEKNMKEKADLSSSILMVNIDSARELPRSKKMSEPSPYVTMSLGQTTEESKIVYDSTDPRWEQGFRFLVHNPNFQTLDVKVMDKKTDRCLGEVNVPLKTLLAAPDMVLDQYHQLKKSDANSEIQMRLALRVLTTERSADWQEQTENLMTEAVEGVNPQGPETSVDSTAPKGTTPATPTPSSPSKPATPGLVATNTKPLETRAGPPATVGAATSQPMPAAKKDDTTVRQRMSSSSSINSNLGANRLGRIQVTHRYSMQRGKFIVVIHKCVGLMACDKDNYSDPYVKLMIMPGKKEKKKTKVINNNLNPVFDETFELGMTPQEMEGKTLEINVKNDTSMFSSSQTLLGVVEIPLTAMDFNKATTEWYDLKANEEMKKQESDV